MSTTAARFSITTPFGNFIATYSENGLAGLNFPNGKTDSSNKVENAQNISSKVRDWHRLTETTLKKILSGEKPGKFPPLDLQGTKFQKGVWREMLKIPYGKTKSYGEIAQAVGNPKAVRAVGGACGANSIPVLVPCHRVLAANNKIGGFGSGLGWKSRLLEIEGVQLG
jgi:O-6-methylguanine DNA methyltransferase